MIVYFLLLNYKKVKESTNGLNANGGQNGIAVSSFQRADVKFLMTRFTVVCFFVMHDMGSYSTTQELDTAFLPDVLE